MILEASSWYLRYGRAAVTPTWIPCMVKDPQALGYRSRLLGA